MQYPAQQFVYRQGDPATALYYILSGTVKVTFNSEIGKEAVIALLGAGDFFGEGCMNGALPRSTTVQTATNARSRGWIVRPSSALSASFRFSEFVHEFSGGAESKTQGRLIDQLFNSSEKRLARILLTLAKTGQEDQPSVIALPINQELLASMVGTTRSRTINS